MYEPLNTVDLKEVEARLPTIFGAPPIRVANAIALLAVFIINGIGGSTLLSGLSTGQVSDSYPNFIVPEGAAFSIWGAIYFFLAAWGIYQLLPRSYNDVTYNEGVGYIFPLNAVCNCTWIIIWAFRIPALSVIFIASILATNAVVYYRLKTNDPNPSWANYFCGHVGFSMYTAWLIGATFVNTFAVATTRDPKFIGETIAALVIVGVIEIFVTLWSGDPIITGVGCWTLCWIYVKNSSVDMLNSASLVLAIILGCVTGIMWAIRVFQMASGRGGVAIA
ncbi:hypothetical protein BCR44DRAFT_125332 [Catenaria anguillulae PL171]|uniref:Tryptophan-rich sensory protein n=1 Tax=Catenaria anguillulae PL171 TaxID=765915 RepID=A0A1Y2HAF4_9FUNG|nr:hypothetical protein BCR44DRAFT_125332 [Catenaria anguillulae PL171]